MAATPKKSLGQHWLTDRLVLAEIADTAKLDASDTVLEIGPGLGTLTSELLRRANRVVAVEIDASLAAKLPGQFPGKDLEVINGDFMDYDLGKLPKNYVVVANVPYYITSRITQRLLTAANRPKRIVMLIQKEVAERMAAPSGEMSLLSLSAQLFAKVSLGQTVSAEYFTPPPKVDSQVVVLDLFAERPYDQATEREFFRLAKAGFSARRKKLRSSLAGGLGLSKDDTERLLLGSGIDPNLRAEALSVEQWQALFANFRGQN
ncbi:ribosomal RNA small subunit methyltransferase A [Candidatus Saccharibacteria bacterium 32-50-10]|nr:MAG: ribosomal RNA small subunit methyltransferase A [Candidatus Saccharibacteria bacterium 32-50-10]